MDKDTFKTYVGFFEKLLQEEDYEEVIKKRLETSTGEEKKTAWKISRAVREMIERRTTVVNALKKEAEKQQANVLTWLELLERSIAMRVETMSHHDVCDITKVRIPYPRRVSCELWDECETKTFTVRSDFIPILQSYFVLFHFQPYIQQAIEREEQASENESFLKRHLDLFNHAMKTCLMCTRSEDFYIQDIY